MYRLKVVDCFNSVYNKSELDELKVKFGYEDNQAYLSSELIEMSMEFPEFNDKIESNRGGINAYIAAEDYQDKFLTYFCPISKLDLKRSKLNELQIETQCRVECKQLSKNFFEN